MRIKSRKNHSSNGEYTVKSSYTARVIRCEEAKNGK
ncbi:MAG: hypothetical protein JWQ40_557 [Segetibacter sp.]|jgi:hypothetical protein|nr:hypothetical protein [Segetibacter sp.]